MKRIAVMCIAAVAVAILTPQVAFSYPFSPFGVSRLLKSSDTVLRVRVLSVKTQGIYTDKSFHPPHESYAQVAEVRVLSVIKGDAVGKVQITYPMTSGPFTDVKPRMAVMYTVLDPGKTYLVFLMGKLPAFQFTDPRNGAMLVPTQTPKESFGSAPQDMMLAELINAAKSDDLATRRLAIEQIGYFGDNRATTFLRGLAIHPDILSIRSAALVSRIEIGDAPSIDELLFVLQQPASSFYAMAKVYDGQPGKEQNDLVMAIMLSVQFGNPDPRKPSKQLKGFDYFTFIEKALKCKVITENDFLRWELINTLRTVADPRSIPLLLGWLDDPDRTVRYDAAMGFAAIADKKDYLVSVDKFNADEAKYISYWKDWAARNRQ